MNGLQAKERQSLPVVGPGSVVTTDQPHEDIDCIEGKYNPFLAMYRIWNINPGVPFDPFNPGEYPPRRRETQGVTVYRGA